MQMRFVYSSFAHTITYDSSGSLVSEADIDDNQLPIYASIWPLYTPTSVLASVGGTDAQLAALLGALGGSTLSSVNPYAYLPAGLIGTGLMPDGNQFIDLDITALIDRVFDDWQWYVDNDPTSTDLPAGFSAGWVTRRADVHAFKDTPSNAMVKVTTGKHDLYTGDQNATLVPTEFGLLYVYGLPSIMEAWIYDIGSGALIGTDADMSVSSMVNPASGVPPTEFEIYEFILGGGAASQFWTNFRACVEDV